jgi:DNA-directed RNA polymerase III subunit RPC6
MLKVLKDAAGGISFRAVMKKEIEVYASYLNLIPVTLLIAPCRKKDMSGEEAMVLGHIQASENEGEIPTCQTSQAIILNSCNS